MTDGYFYGITLSSDATSDTWDPEEKAEYPRSNRLFIRQAVLGHNAKADEFNVVQVEAMSLRETIKIPMVVLKAGETRQVKLDLEFPDAPVTFRLIEGNGPVYIIGQTLLGSMVENFDEMEEMEEEMLSEEEGEETQFKGDEKKKNGSAAKRMMNEDEDEDEGEPKGKKSKVSNNAKGKAPSPKKNAKK